MDDRVNHRAALAPIGAYVSQGDTSEPILRLANATLAMHQAQ